MASKQYSTLTFLGAAGTVTGSKFLLTVGSRRILIDCGMFQGDQEWRDRNWDQFPVPPSSITDVILTHAHMDHSGYLPALARDGFSGPIWATDGTIKLAEIVLRDSGYLQEMDAENALRGGWSKYDPPKPLYTVEDVERTLPQFRFADFDIDHDLGDGIIVRLTRAGHILGAASVHVTLPDTTILFSGDLGRHDHPVLRPREIPSGAAFVLVESTYGDREHPEGEDGNHEPLADAIRRTVARGGSVLVPAFAVDRTEVLLKTLGEMRRENRIPEVPIFVNSPMGVAALRVYQDPSQRDELHPELRDSDFLDLAHVHEVTSTEDSIKLNAPKMPCIIISSSGMATGGRVVHHLEHMLPDHRNTVVFTGYQAYGTRGRLLVDGAKEMKIHGRYVPVRADVLLDASFSVHGDSSDLIDWLAELDPKPETVFAVHGESGAPALAERAKAELGLLTVVPRYGEMVRLKTSRTGAPDVITEGEPPASRDSDQRGVQD